MRRAISRSATTEAALYFDEVFPEDLWSTVYGIAKGVPDIKKMSVALLPGFLPDPNVMASLLPGDPAAQKRAADFMTLSLVFYLSVQDFSEITDEAGFHESHAPLIKLLKDRFNIDYKYDFLKPSPEFQERVESIQFKILKESGFVGASSWFHEDLYKFITSKSTRDAADFAVSIRNLNLVDASKLSWESIIEFRKDRASRNALINLRLFFQDNLSGKDAGYISDRLSQLMVEYESAAKLWGFETAQKTLSAVFSQHTALATAASTIAVATTGAALPIVAAAGLIVPLGSAGLEFSKAVIDGRKSRPNSPAEYLTSLKKLGR